MSVTIDPEFASILPPLEPDELALLTASLLADDGCRDPLVLWNGTLVDGHNRYAICQEHGIDFATVERAFPSRAEAKAWMVTNQAARRNWSVYVRGELWVLHVAPVETAKGKVNQGLPSLSPRLEKVDTTEKMTTATGMGYGTASKVQQLVDKADEITKLKLRSGKISIDKAYTDMKGKAKRKERVAQIVEDAVEPPPLTSLTQRYAVIYADPPWSYSADEPSAATANRDIDANQYPTMAFDELCALPVEDIATPSAALFMWATPPMLQRALNVMEAWGFQYKTNAMWDKEIIGMGYWFRIQHEHLLVGVRGDFPRPEPATRVSSVFRERRGKHSAKPGQIRDAITAMFPDLPRIELFARTASAGWDVWGNECQRLVSPAA